MRGWWEQGQSSSQPVPEQRDTGDPVPDQYQDRRRAGTPSSPVPGQRDGEDPVWVRYRSKGMAGTLSRVGTGTDGWQRSRSGKEPGQAHHDDPVPMWSALVTAGNRSREPILIRSRSRHSEEPVPGQRRARPVPLPSPHTASSFGPTPASEAEAPTLPVGVGLPVPRPGVGCPVAGGPQSALTVLCAGRAQPQRAEQEAVADQHQRPRGRPAARPHPPPSAATLARHSSAAPAPRPRPSPPCHAHWLSPPDPASPLVGLVVSRPARTAGAVGDSAGRPWEVPVVLPGLAWGGAGDAR